MVITPDGNKLVAIRAMPGFKMATFDFETMKAEDFYKFTLVNFRHAVCQSRP